MSSDDTGRAIPRRILLRGTNWVGDTIMSLPAARELRRIFPDSTVTFWCPAGLTDLVDAAAVADEIISFDPGAAGPTRRVLQMRKPLARRDFDMVVLFQNAFESALTAWISGIPIRAGYPTDLRGPLLNLKIPLKPEIREQHQVYYYLGLTDHLEEVFLGRSRRNAAVPDCSIPLSPETILAARNLLHSSGIEPDRPLFTLCPGSVNSEAKRWPADSFAALADLLTRELDASVVILGAPGEADLAREVMALARKGRVVNLAGRAGMVTSMAVMNLSSAVISNDTGSAHLAAAAEALVFTLFGPTSAGATAPFSTRAHVVQGSADCAPCRHFRCPLPGHPCMRSIEPERVLAQVRVALAGRPKPEALSS